MRVSVIDETPRAALTVRQKTAVGLRRALDDFERIADPMTPKDTGDLRARKLKQMLSTTSAAIAWLIVYAGVQERGRHPVSGTAFRNYTTPGTGPNFAFRAAQQVAQNGSRYFG